MLTFGPMLDPGPVCMKNVYKVALGQVFLQVLRFSAVNIIPLVQHTHFIHLPLMLYLNNLD